MTDRLNFTSPNKIYQTNQIIFSSQSIQYSKLDVLSLIICKLQGSVWQKIMSIKKLFAASFIFLSITSCAVFKEQRIIINPNPNINTSKIGQKEKIKVNIYDKSIFIGDKIGNRIPPNLNGSNQGLVVSGSNLDDIIKHKLQEWLQKNDFLVVEFGNKKTLNARVIYLNYKSRNGFIEDGKITINMAIKITVSDNRNHDIYSKLYLIENDIGWQPRDDEEITTGNINKTIEEILNKIFSDKNLINNLIY